MNTDGLYTTVLDQPTIQVFSQQLLDDPNARNPELADFLRAQSEGALDDIVDADLIIRFFQEAFGIAPDLRSEADTLRFVPNDLGDGVRWDNSQNWNTEDLPGMQDGDSVDLGGNHVVFGTDAEIDEMAISDGALNDYGGRLDVTGGITDGGHLNVEVAGHAWTDGHSSDEVLDIDVSGGCFANIGKMGTIDLDVAGGQAILATDGAEYDVKAGHTLMIFDAAAKVGFDGDGGMAILEMEEGATVKLGLSDGEMAPTEEFRSGAFSDAPNVQSGIDLRNATMEIDLAGISASQAGSFTPMDADEIVDIVDAATLELTAGGSGAIDVSTIGDQRQSDHDALWEALTADQGLAEDQPLPEDEELLDIAWSFACENRADKPMIIMGKRENLPEFSGRFFVRPCPS